ncbi:hypothetical protein [Sphingomonas lenta]|uniref:hypothetical protein n=1 Tax=Sphingomonas lenta TaxID=1141887 RepID=UPI001595EDD7|nr:hypothetical protein [Sphingomonas lenta]
MTVQPDRRSFLQLSLAAPLLYFGRVDALAAPAARSTMRDLVRDPLLRGLFGRPLGEFGPNGAAGLNRESFRFIEYQRQGAEWITRGVVRSKRDWIRNGWLIIDYGLAQQQPDGGFPGDDVQHSASLFLEAAARACLIDPGGATPARRATLLKAGRWMTAPAMEADAASHSAPFTHRRYVMASMLGQIGAVTGDAALIRRAAQWAREGIALQRPDGVNPERGGFDASYQAAGALFAERYLASCVDPTMRAAVSGMIRRAVPPVLAKQRPDGSIDPTGSTRIGVETYRGGKVKEFNYEEGVQALVYGSRLINEPRWRGAAAKMVELKGWSRA